MSEPNFKNNSVEILIASNDKQLILSQPEVSKFLSIFSNKIGIDESIIDFIFDSKKDNYKNDSTKQDQNTKNDIKENKEKIESKIKSYEKQLQEVNIKIQEMYKDLVLYCKLKPLLKRKQKILLLIHEEKNNILKC